MKRILRKLLPFAVLAGCAALGLVLIKTGPTPKRQPPQAAVPTVEVLQVKPGVYQVNLRSRGTIAPRTQSTLVSEVAGRIINVAPDFQNGGAFASGEILIHIEPAEYQLEVDNIQASVTGVEAKQAELATTEQNLKKSLTIEVQQLELAHKQFQRLAKLQKQGTVSQSAVEDSEREYLQRSASVQGLKNSLELIPAQSRLLTSEYQLKKAQLARAQLDLKRTAVTAPYAGRVLEKRVDLGQSVSKGTILGTIYATDELEIRLPISDHQMAFLQQTTGATEAGTGSEVLLSATVGDTISRWQGRILRTEAAIDPRTRQSFLVAQIDAPYTTSTGGTPNPKIGQFVEAEIHGRTLQDVFVLPRSSVRANDEVMLITAEDRIKRQQLDVIWRDQEHVVVADGLQPGDRISLTALPYAPDGSRVLLAGAQARPAAGAAEKPVIAEK